MIRRLRLKFIAVNMIIVTFLLVLMMTVVFHFTGSSIERESISMMRQFFMIPPMIEVPNTKSETIRLPYFSLKVNSEGIITEVSGNYYDLTDNASLRTVLNEALNDGKESGILEQFDLRYLRIFAQDEKFYLFADMSNELRMMSSLMRSCFIISLIGFVLFLIIVIILSYWTVRPVEKAWDTQKQFIADASHELKTPLTVILTNAELLKEPAFSDHEKEQFTEHICTESQRMRSLIERLLDLARSDISKHHTDMTSVNLSDVVSGESMLFEPVLFEKQLELSSRIEPDLHVKGDEQALHQAIAILLDNAGKYSTPGTIVELVLNRSGSTVRLSVINVGAALSKEQQKNIFRRFYRADTARTSDGSYGLGLPIADAIVKRHRGKISVQSNNGQNIFTITLRSC